LIMRLFVILLVCLPVFTAVLYDFSASEERHVKKMILTSYCANICLDKCETRTDRNGTLTCAVPPCPELPCDSGCVKRCIFAQKFLPHWLP
ncbi:hypothetical protein PENTCL1PPCAC_25830, partial [Pristionchus entomophagus]